jgi:ATP-dependent protease ClpP protease subunit/predicted  nucleic acid-binding Zn-ribbon protein
MENKHADSNTKNGTFSFPLIPHNSLDVTEELPIYLTGYVGETFFQDGIELTRLRNEVEAYKPKKVKMYLSTEGGDMKAAFDIVSYMKSQKDVTFTVVNAGLVASAGTIILMGADKAESYNYGIGMVHKPSMMAYGDESAMQKAIDTLQVFENSIYPIYLDRIEKNKKLVNNSKEDTLTYLKSLMKPSEMTWLSAEEMLQIGFIDKIINQTTQTKTVQNHVMNSLSIFNTIPNKHKDNLSTVFSADINKDFQTEKEKDMDFSKIINAFKAKFINVELADNATDSEIVEVINKIEVPTVDNAAAVNNEVTEQLKSEVEGFSAKVENLTNLLTEFKTKIETVENKAAEFETENKALKAAVTNLQNDNTKLSGELASIKGSSAPVQQSSGDGNTVVEEKKAVPFNRAGVRTGIATVITPN